MTIDTASAAETREVGRRLGAACAPSQVIGLVGDLGAGKTVLAQGIGAGLCVREPVSSPTFNLAQQYSGRLALWHLDLYRLSRREELDDLSWEELLQARAVIVVEWSDRIAGALPDDRLEIAIADRGGDLRRLTLTATGARSVALLRALREAR